MYVFTIVLRAVHIVCGTFWTGAAVLIAFFVQPAVVALGPDGGKFMQRLTGQGRIHLWFHAASTLTVAAGVILFIQDIDFAGTTAGISYSVGGAGGLAAWLVGAIVTAPAAAGIAALGREIQGQNGPPSAEQASRMQALQRRIAVGARTGAILLLGTVAAMAIARYL